MTAHERSTFRKTDDFPGATRVEAQGLQWLAEASTDGGAHVVPVTVGDGWIEEPRLRSTSVTAAAAEAFGRALAVTHAAGAPVFGAAPPGWDGRTRMGRSNIRLRDASSEDDAAAPRPWGVFYAEDRIEPYVRPGRDSGALSPHDAAVIEHVCERLRDGELDSPQPRLVEEAAAEAGRPVAVARTHGDLWCGNVLWVPTEDTASWAPRAAGRGPDDRDPGDVVGVLIDPMAHGAHAETDLGALGLFGQRHLERVYAGYNEVSPLADGWRERIGLHQLHILMLHVYLFGGGYGPEAASVARQYA
ncbi:fructosamine kinase family protein [Actinomyces haliotis]|uniref:fructosamine kinase family protein n=1 Tax=Actinomyces haliotis TaxID=1280843 RepID=UPI0018903075|nr:fructosamine kinase family protein [Actinomyces haliotis]